MDMDDPNILAINDYGNSESPDSGWQPQWPSESSHLGPISDQPEGWVPPRIDPATLTAREQHCYLCLTHLQEVINHEAGIPELTGGDRVHVIQSMEEFRDIQTAIAGRRPELGTTIILQQPYNFRPKQRCPRNWSSSLCQCCRNPKLTTPAPGKLCSARPAWPQICTVAPGGSARSQVK